MSAPPTEPSAAAGRRSYKMAGPQTWALARELYLAGLPGPEVAARLDISVHNLRKKATREGWSRRAHAERVLDVRLPAVGGDRRTWRLPGEACAPGGGAPSGEGPGAGPLPADARPDEPPAEADPAEAAETLVRRAAALALAGRVEDASAHLKTAEALRRAAEASPAACDAPDGWEAEEAAETEPAPPRTPEADAELGFKLARMAWRLSQQRGAPAELVEAQQAQTELKYAAWAALTAARDPSAPPPPR